MSMTVLDASAALALLLPSQATAASEAFLEDAGRRQFFAPPIFPWEVAHVLLRRFTNEPQRAQHGFNHLMALPVNAVAAADPTQPASLMGLAALHRLTLFDAAYLDLALALDAPLATRDAALISAASQAGAAAIDLR